MVKRAIRGRGSRKKSGVGVGVEGAEFFKVFIPLFHSHQLLIPPDFVKNFKKTMREKVILKNIHGKAWSVDTKETPNGVFLDGEWQSFVDYHGLNVGDFLVFEYHGSYTFVVKIFSPNGCKKDKFGPINSEERTLEEMKPKNVDHFSSVGTRNRHSERFREVKEEEGGVSEQPEKSKEFDDRDRDLPQCASFTSDPGAYRAKMRIPDSVMKKANVPLRGQMFLRDEEGKDWPVKIFTLPGGPTFLGQGLLDFHKAKNVGSKGRCRFTFGVGDEESSTIIKVEVLP